MSASMFTSILSGKIRSHNWERVNIWVELIVGCLDSESFLRVYIEAYHDI